MHLGKREEHGKWHGMKSTDTASGTVQNGKNKKKKEAKYQPEPSLSGQDSDGGDGKKTVPGVEKWFAPGQLLSPCTVFPTPGQK